MHGDVQLIIAGLGSGAAYALLAVGLVVIFRGSGVLNFGQGAVASLSAYLFLYLSIDKHVFKVGAALIAIAVAAGLGMIFQALVMKRLSRAPALAKVVATLGLLVALTAAIPLLFSDKTRPPVPMFSSGILTIPIGHPRFFIPYDRLWLVVIACGLTLILWLVYRYTIFGKATRAVSENERAVASLGYSPNTIALVNWALGSMLAGVAGVLLAGLINLDQTTLTLVMIAAIASSLLGGFRSFGITLAAAFGLSALQSELIKYSPQLTRTTTIVGWGDIAPFFVILVFMIVRGAPIPLRGSLTELRLPTVPVVRRPLRAAAITFGVGVALYATVSGTWADALSVTMIGGLACLSLVVLVGFLGQVSVVQMALAGLGAFWASIAAQSWGLPFPLPVLIGSLLAVPFGLVAAVPALRVRGINLAVLTISAALALDASFFTDVRLSAGARFPRAALGSFNLSGVQHPKVYGIFVLACSVLLGLGVVYLRKSPLGVRFLALRANERGASSLGVSLVRTKLMGFALAAFIAGVAGGLAGYRSQTLSYDTFGAFQSLLVVAFAYLGGIGTAIGAFIAGSLLPGGLFAHIFNVQGNAARALEALGGVGVMVTTVLHPDGLALLPRDVAERIRGRRHGRGAALESKESKESKESNGPEPAASSNGAGGAEHPVPAIEEVAT
jgi:branched-subunit amino acid ABC-type transport system permease component